MKTRLTIALLFCFFNVFGQETEQETKVLRGKTKIKTKSSKDFKFDKIYFGIFPNASAVIEPLSKDWGNKKTGTGFLQGFGGNAEIGYKVHEKFIPFLSVGIANWKVTKRYIADKVVVSQSSTSLNTIPIGVGFRYQFSSKMYFSPMVCLQKIKLNNRNQDDELILNITDQKIGASAKIGFTKSFKSFKLDYGLHYNILLNDQFLTYRKSLHYAGLMVGFSI